MMVDWAVLSFLEANPCNLVTVFELEDAHARGLVGIAPYGFGDLQGNGMVVDVDSNGIQYPAMAARRRSKTHVQACMR